MRSKCNLVKTGEGFVSENGVDHGGDGRIIAGTHEYLAVKWPAHNYWAGRGERGYASPHTEIYKIMELVDDPQRRRIYRCRHLIGWENSKKK